MPEDAVELDADQSAVAEGDLCGGVGRGATAFERQFRAAMAAAAETMDLSKVLELLRAWQRIAELTASMAGRTAGGSWPRAYGPDATVISRFRTRNAMPARSTSCCGIG